MINKKVVEEENHALVDIDEKLEKNPVYKKLLNNLLGIKNRDNSIFISSRVLNFDLSKLISQNDLKKLLSGKTFTVKIDNSSDQIVTELNQITNYIDFIEIINSEGILLSISDRKLLEKNFSSHKSDVVEKLKIKGNKKIAKWKRFRNKYLDIQTQINSWPLYVGTLIVEVKMPTSTLRAPLIMKKVEINISTTNKVQIKSIDDSVEINEKLLFLLQNEYKFNLPKLDPSNQLSLKDVALEFEKYLSSIFSNTPKIQEKFEFKTKNDVTNSELRFAAGSLLCISSPSGGKLREKLIELISENGLDNLLATDSLKNIKDEINQKLKNQEPIYRITPTDLSQEKAILASLDESTIIWGPPGTGKSQTITNILVNILMNEKTAIVTSEKKAALDVIAKRMSKISKYMFFGLTDKNVNKEEFYDPFKKLIKSVIEKDEFIKKQKANSFINNSHVEMSKQIDILYNENIDSIIEIRKFIATQKISTEKVIEAYKLFKEFKSLVIYNDNILQKLDIEGVKKKGLIFKRYPRQIRKIIRLDRIFNNVKINKSIIKIKNIKNFMTFNKYLQNEREYVGESIEFHNDINYIDKVLSFRFYNRLNSLRNNHETAKETASFINAAQKGWRLPYKFVDKYKNVILKLFDIFVSTPQTLANSIDTHSHYDYAVFDEASQLHLEKAIPFISMANISIIAGDNQQMRPTSYFGLRDRSMNNDENEEDVDSLLDYAYRKGLSSREFILSKNYRSKSSDLMKFSSKEFYKSKLDVVDVVGKEKYESIEVYNVEGKWEATTNEIEANKALEILINEKDNFKKIILLTFNASQKSYMENLIYSKSKYSEIIELLRDEKVYLRNLENIQGDEADLVIISVAYDKNAKLGSTYVARPEGKNALNVAISRAVEKMIVVKSISSLEVSSNNKNDSIRIFKEWLNFLELSTNERKLFLIESNKAAEQFDSSFEEDVYDEISKIKFSKKFIIETQYNVGSYFIDIAILEEHNNKFVLGIEVDGYRYHSGFEKITKDIERQMFIEAKGYYPILRVKELDWKTDKQKVLQKISNVIKEF